MSKFRKKPVVIEAFQWNGQDVPGYDMINMGTSGDGTYSTLLIIPTLEGTMYASLGDFIITGVKGEVYPCKPDIFEATYEAVKDGE
jgi:hypothetical protein